MRHGLDGRVFLNASPSMPMGYYWLTPGSSNRRGEVILACPPARFLRWAKAVKLLGPGLCDGVESVVKRVVAIAGDRVRIDARGVFVDGRYLDGTRLYTLLDDGARCGWRAPVPHVAFGERTLPPGEVQLAGGRRSQSRDGRSSQV